MARPHRIYIPDGWYHVMSRGIDRRTIFVDDRDQLHFLGLVEKMAERYDIKVHAYVLMGNHYHLLVQTPQANLSRAMQWLNVSYGVWFNKRHPRVGPLFQGRFKSVPVDGEGSWAFQASIYLHLNPVRIKGLGLGKRERMAEGRGMTPPPEMVKARLETLRRHHWSSYPAYAGYVPKPDWLTCDDIWKRARHGDLSVTESYRWQVETPLRGGGDEPQALWEKLTGVLAIGSPAFLARLRRGVRGNRTEQKAIRAWQRMLPFSRVTEAVEIEMGERWDQFRDRRGHVGRDLALWFGRHHCGLTLSELGAAAGGMSYPAVNMAIRRLDMLRKEDRVLRKTLSRIEEALCNVQT